jgi:hypothetical protein
MHALRWRFTWFCVLLQVLAQYDGTAARWYDMHDDRCFTKVSTTTTPFTLSFTQSHVLLFVHCSAGDHAAVCTVLYCSLYEFVYLRTELL